MIPDTFTCPICKDDVNTRSTIEVHKYMVKRFKYVLTCTCENCFHRISFDIEENLFIELYNECENFWKSRNFPKKEQNQPKTPFARIKEFFDRRIK